MKWLVPLLLVLLLLLQYRLWVGEGSFAEVVGLKREIAAQEQELKRLTARNRALQAEVDSLKQDLEAVEERARRDLGMIRENEVFFQVLDESRSPEPAQ